MLETKVERTGVFDESQASSAGPEAFGQSLVGLIDRLGRYVLLDRLGRGAFGTVWAAYDPQLDRRVAIKIVHAPHEGSRDSLEQTRDELLSEAQLLAQLSHPNVVAIHDVGRLEDALGPRAALLLGGSEQARAVVGVFIVMEYLGGSTLGEWLKPVDPESSVEASAVSRRSGGLRSSASASSSMLGVRDVVERAGARDPAQIIEVFCEAGRGLEAAHARGLAHLDFKPGNVMFGDDGRVRVLDFGLARAGRKLAPANVERTRVAGTPAYMAPEQHLGEDTIDARADQFAFCVALWEALCGERPFVGEDTKALFRAKHAGPRAIPAGRVVAPHIHTALLRGLSYDPGERFESMAVLLDVLRDDPSLRRRRVLATGGLVVALVGAGFGLARAAGEGGPARDPCALAADQFVEVWDEPRRAAIEAAYARSGVPTAPSAMAQVVAALDEAVAAWTTVRTEVCRDALVEGQVSVEQMSEELLCLDRQLRSIAGLSRTLGEADAELVARGVEPLATLPEAEDCRLRRGGGASEGQGALGDERRLALLGVEDALSQAALMYEIGRLDEAKRATEEALQGAEAIGAARELARAQLQLGRVSLGQGELDDAAAACLAGLGHAAPLDDPRLESELLQALMATQIAAGEFVAAGTVQELLGARLDASREPDLARALHFSSAIWHERQQHWDEALAELDRALELLERETNPKPSIRAEILAGRGNVYVGSGRDFDQAKAAYVESIDMLAGAYGEYHPAVSKARINLGAVYARQGDFERAIDELQAAYDALAPVYPEGHPYLSKCAQNLGALRTMTGEFARAIEHTRESLASAEAKLGPDHPDYATVERNLATLLLLRGRHREAAQHREHAAEVYAASYEASDTRRMAIAAELAEIYWWLGEEEQGRRQLELAREGMAAAEATDIRVFGVLSILAMFELDAGDAKASLGHAEALLAFGQKVLPPDAPDLARARVQIAAALRKLGRFDDARAQLDEAEAVLVVDPERLHPHLWEVLAERGRVELAAGDVDEAQTRFEAARERTEAEELPVYRAYVEVELAAVLEADEPEAAASMRARAESALEDAGVRIPNGAN